MSCIRYWRSRSRLFSYCKSALVRVRTFGCLAWRRRGGIWLGAVCRCTLCAMWSPSRACEHLARLLCPAGGGQRERFNGICGRRGNPINVGVELGVGVRRQVVGPTKQQERSVTMAANGHVGQLAGRRRIADALMSGSGRSIVSPTAANSYPEVCVCALR